MLKTRIKRRAAQGERAVDELAEINKSITALNNEDLLDLADIFSREPRPLLGDMAFAELAERHLSL